MESSNQQMPAEDRLRRLEASLSCSRRMRSPTPERSYRKRTRDEEPKETNAIHLKRFKMKSWNMECAICGDDIGEDEFPKQPHSAPEHTANVCSSCWEKHLEVEIDIKAHNEIHCAQCSEILSSEDIRKLASKETYEKWSDKAFKAEVESDTEWQTCPSASCGYGGYLSEGNFFICQMCNAWYCTECKVPMHSGETCEVYQERIRIEDEERKTKRAQDEKKSEDEVKAISKTCPKCGASLQKRSGCDHFTCRCKHEFCWQCLAPYKGGKGINSSMGNRAHQETCPHHPKNLPDLEGPWDDEGSDDDDSNDDSSNDTNSDYGEDGAIDHILRLG